jgi:hypothetical protein
MTEVMKRCPMCTVMMHAERSKFKWRWFWQRRWTRVERTIYRCPMCRREEETIVRSWSE